MAKEKNAAMGGFLQELFQVGVYKRNQGRVARQVTGVALGVIAAYGTYSLWNTLGRELALPYVAAMLGVLLAGFWLAFRLVNYPQFADFLIAVEAEMNKVSWPTWKVLVRSSIVVILVILLLSAFLFLFDWFWQVIFTGLGISA
jgi:preprotein translocase subunit SecE